MPSETALTALHDDFVATSTQSMPLAGIIFWTSSPSPAGCSRRRRSPTWSASEAARSFRWRC